MSKMKDMSIPKIGDVREEAVKTLIAELGLVKSAILFKGYFSHEVDYLDIKRDMFGDKTVNEIAEELNK